jgi:hypothetical protein
MADQRDQSDDAFADEIEFDPRWEVQPGSFDGDTPGGDRRTALIGIVVLVTLLGVVAWLALGGLAGT